MAIPAPLPHPAAPTAFGSDGLRAAG